jgi:hypothetical protein
MNDEFERIWKGAAAVLPRDLLEKIDENHENPYRIAGIWPKFERRTSRIRV